MRAMSAMMVLGLLHVGVLTRDAEGQFSAEPSITIGSISCPYGIEVGDLNNDGRADLAVASWVRNANGKGYDDTKSRVLILFQRDSGLGLPADRQLTVTNPVGLCVGDFDNDGRNDLAVAPYGKLYLFLARDDFERGMQFHNVNRQVPVISAGRVGRDGVCDFFTGPVWRRWRGKGSVSNGYIYGPEINDNGLCKLADLDHDGHLDLVCTSRGDKGEIRLYYGPHLSLSVFPNDVSQFRRLSCPRRLRQSLGIADLNDDGRPDIVTSTASDPDPVRCRILIHYQNAPLDFTSGAAPSAEIVGLSGDVLTTDIDRDGLSDLLVADGRKVWVFRQERGKPFPGEAVGADQVLSTEVYAVTTGDVNGDGYPDLVLTAVRGGKLQVFLNKASARRGAAP